MHWPGQTDLLTWCQNMGPLMGAVLLIGGVIYLLFGVQSFKVLIMVNAALIGGFLGAVMGHRTGSPLTGAAIGGFTAAAITWPLMKYTVALMGGLYGALLGAALWHTAGLQGEFAWAGALTGLVFFSMLSFILFHGSIMMYTSLQGSVMLVFGLLGLIFKYQELAPKLLEGMSGRPSVLPIAIFAAAIIGLIYQQSQHGAAAVAAGGGEKKK
jgi:hypothetical protein